MEPNTDPWKRLTPMQRSVVKEVCKGSTNREIGARLSLSPRTVQRHLYEAFRRLGVTTRTELAVTVLAWGPVEGSSERSRSIGDGPPDPTATSGRRAGALEGEHPFSEMDLADPEET